MIKEFLKRCNELSNGKVVFREAKSDDINYMKHWCFLKEEINVIERNNIDINDFLAHVVNSAMYIVTVEKDGCPLIVFGINKEKLNDCTEIWLLPHTQTTHKKLLSWVAKKILKPTVVAFFGDTVCVEHVENETGIRWVKFLGGKLLDTILLSGEEFFIVKFSEV